MSGEGTSKRVGGQWSRTVEVNGKVVKEDYGTMDYPDLYKHDGNAGVSANMGFSTEYSSAKCSVAVSLRCDQNEPAIDRAGELALRKSRELATEGMAMAIEALEASGR